MRRRQQNVELVLYAVWPVVPALMFKTRQAHDWVVRCKIACGLVEGSSEEVKKKRCERTFGREEGRRRHS